MVALETDGFERTVRFVSVATFGCDKAQGGFDNASTDRLWRTTDTELRKAPGETPAPSYYWLVKG